MRVIVQDADADLTELAVWMLNIEHGAVVHGENPPHAKLPPEEWRPWPLVALPASTIHGIDHAPKLHIRASVGHVFMADNWAADPPAEPPAAEAESPGPWLAPAWVERLKQKLSEYDQSHLAWVTQGASPSCYIRRQVRALAGGKQSALPHRQLVESSSISARTGSVEAGSPVFVWHFLPCRAAVLDSVSSLAEATAIAASILVVPPGRTRLRPRAEIEMLRAEDVTLMPAARRGLLLCLAKYSVLLLGDKDDGAGPRFVVRDDKAMLSGFLLSSTDDEMSDLLGAKWTRMRPGVYLVRESSGAELIAHSITIERLYSYYPGLYLPAVRVRLGAAKVRNH